ncbi:hypothetical protein BDV96DRAFT_597807 [Lophiotrema nucula]|uniref:DUF6594 domain-containing protein n=1 Tax=Lophiotrema nucula TaxID=690887 RepID=A0A6A5ZGS2_9PLEO|nr:hypothetical protein BDV96DRAFT_597807 [Lophiotrema nucula]
MAPTQAGQAPNEKAPAHNEQPTLQVQCTCLCRHESASFAPSTDSWDRALDMHEGGFMRLVTKYRSSLSWFYQVSNDTLPTIYECGYRVNFAEMHRMYMRALQIELVKMGVALQFKQDDPNATEDERRKRQDERQAARENLEPALAKYTQAVRDYDYMTSSSSAYDFFIASSERFHDHKVNRSAMDRRTFDDTVLYNKEKGDLLHTGPWENDKKGYVNPIGGTRNDNIKSLSRHAFWWKLGAAIVGAGFLVGPMWLLALKQRLYLQLEVTTGFVFGFGLILAYFVDKIDQVFAGTLAYAAVLMVFVGLSIQGAGAS